MRHLAFAVAACLTLAGLSVLLAPGAPGYDAWAWLLWGREIGRLELDTVAGPAWKPLPVAVTTALGPAGRAAPELWLWLARAGALAAVALGFAVARRLAPARLGVPAGVAGALGVLLTGGVVRHAAVGDAEPLLVALLLGAVHRGVDGRHRQAIGLAGAAALVRPEVWPFLALYGLWRRREDGLLAAGVAVLVGAAWFLPELAGSGELLRSGERARMPNPGQPATADAPSLATLGAAASVVVAPLAVTAIAARGAAAALGLAGAAWIGLVAAMSEAGFSGEPRYALPGAALVAVAGAAGAARLAGRVRTLRPRLGATLAAAGASALLAGALAPRVAELRGLGPRLAHQQALVAGLERVIVRGGGREALLACGRPAVGRYRGTLLAWHLDVPKRVVRADGRPGDVTFASRLTPSAVATPPRAGPVLARAPGWRLSARCPYSRGRA